jgi:hypothetical protein
MSEDQFGKYKNDRSATNKKINGDSSEIGDKGIDLEVNINQRNVSSADDQVRGDNGYSGMSFDHKVSTNEVPGSLQDQRQNEIEVSLMFNEDFEQEVYEYSKISCLVFDPLMYIFTFQYFPVDGPDQ